jgi:hypothetical protein
MMFHVGQKVVCVDDRLVKDYARSAVYKEFAGGLDGLKSGLVYTVRASGFYTPVPGVPVVWLSEIVRPIRSQADEIYGEAPFAAARFRPVVERKTDISIFTAMLDRAPSRELVDAS